MQLLQGKVKTKNKKKVYIIYISHARTFMYKNNKVNAV